MIDIDTNGYDFLDFGYGKGGAYNFSIKKLGGKHGISIDLKKSCCDLANKRNHKCVNVNILDCNFTKKSVKFVSIVHFLEHMKSMVDIKTVLNKAMCVANDFVFIEGPLFDFDDYLKTHGFKFFWSDWIGHPTHVKTTDIIEILKSLGFYSYSLYYFDKVYSSLDKSIHPLNSKKDQFEYDYSKHPKKNLFNFSEVLYKYFILIGNINKNKRNFSSCRAGLTFISEAKF